MSYNIITPQDFGAIGNYVPTTTGPGGADDTAAFMQAIAAAGALPNGRVVVPPAQMGCGYKVTQSLKPLGPMKILGDGPNAATIFGHNFAPGVPIFDYDFVPAQVVEHGELSGLTLRSNNGNPIGVRVKDHSYLHLEDMVLDELVDGIVYTGSRCFSNSAERVHGRRISGSTVKWSSFRGGGQYTFQHCTFSGDIGTLQDNDSMMDAVSLLGCNWEGCKSFAGRFVGTIDGLTMNPRTEGGRGPYDFVFCPGADPRWRPGDDPNNKNHHQSGLVVQGGMFTANSASCVAMLFGGDTGKVRGPTILGNTARNSSASVFAYMYGSVEDAVIMGNDLAQPYSQLINTGAVVPGLFARANRNGTGQLANIG